MIRVEFCTNTSIVDDVTEKLKEFDMSYEELCDFVFDYKEAVENIKKYEDELKDIKKEIKKLGIQDLFKEIYSNSDFEVYDD